MSRCMDLETPIRDIDTLSSLFPDLLDEAAAGDTAAISALYYLVKQLRREATTLRERFDEIYSSNPA